MVLRLRARQLWKTAARKPLMVQSVSGTLWVTAGHEDVLLESGESSVFTGPYPVVIQALSDAELTFRAAPPPSPPKR